MDPDRTTGPAPLPTLAAAWLTSLVVLAAITGAADGRTGCAAPQATRATPAAPAADLDRDLDGILAHD